VGPARCRRACVDERGDMVTPCTRAFVEATNC
jgi:hypothetical protein